jgi:hypothetical protein
MRLAAHRAAPHGVAETLLVASIRSFCLALFPVQRALPSQRVGEKSQVSLVAEKSYRLLIETQ